MHCKSELMKYLYKYEPLEMRGEDWNTFNSQTKCGVCQKEFYDNEPAAKDHNHHSGVYRDKCHMGCNLNRKKERNIVCYSHNMRGYDGHFIVKNLQ